MKIRQILLNAESLRFKKSNGDGKAMDRLLATVDALKQNNQKITARLLKSYGYGQRVILEYMNNKENLV